MLQIRIRFFNTVEKGKEWINLMRFIMYCVIVWYLILLLILDIDSIVQSDSPSEFSMFEDNLMSSFSSVLR